MRRPLRLLSLLFLAGSGSCSVNDAVGELGAQALYCARPGPAWLVDETGREVCGGRLAARSFQRALCVCGGMESSTRFRTSTQGTSGVHEASVEVRGRLSVNDGADIDGSLQVEGAEGITVRNVLGVEGTLRSQGVLSDATQTARVTVGGDAWVAGGIRLGALAVGGLLHHPRAQPLEVGELLLASDILDEPVERPASACSCEPPAPIAQVVARNAPLHHNEGIGLMVGALENVPAGETRARELPCGRFVLDGISGPGAVRLAVTGRAMLFVARGVTVADLEVRLAEGAQLDLFIAGSLAVKERLVLDSGARPSRLRIYVGGGLELPEESLVEAHLSAPGALLSLGAALELSGSLNVGSLAQAGPLALSYDPEVRVLAEACSDGG